ncbi:Cysteine desulfurase [Granulicella sibirica]|uniref:Cysteine desulfurase n=2 Tax=Granulicella sibirica TaxID=2479048 RepID=A0A4Q0T5A2_9BACT|nr:Cysteine desulfurase [Granulicella sibirica]
MTRRQIAKGMGMAALGNLAAARVTGSVVESNALPARSEFATDQYETCLNNARWHPLSHGAKQAVIAYLEYKQRGIWNPPDEVSNAQKDVKAAFAGLIHADPSEIAYVNSTTAAENLFVAALGFPGAQGNIVTDALHFEGSLYLYEALRRQGVDVRVVRPKDWQVTTEDLAAVVDKNTRLVAVSKVSYINGFEHDINGICDLAHTHGALVYADAVQAAGAIPIDVRAWGVDALACASYKWLMGDMGLGFLYVRQDVLPKLKRTQFGYRQLGTFDYHVFPWDKPGPYPIEYKEHPDTAGMFEIGTYDNATVAALSYSIPTIQRLGVERIQAHAQALLAPLKKELPRLGYPLITPDGSRASMASFLVSDHEKTKAALKKANVDVSLETGRMRVSPSIYNDENDIQKLLNALS